MFINALLLRVYVLSHYDVAKMLHGIEAGVHFFCAVLRRIYNRKVINRHKKTSEVEVLFSSS